MLFAVGESLSVVGLGCGRGQMWTKIVLETYELCWELDLKGAKVFQNERVIQK